LLDRRLNPLPFDQTVSASGLQQPQDLNLEDLSLEYRNPPLLPPFPVEHNPTEYNPTLVHDFFASDVPPQGHDVPQFNCDFCSRTFSLRYELNIHVKIHTKPFKCPIKTCDFQGARYRKDRDRHIVSRHRAHVPNLKRFYCPIETCKHSETNKEGFARTDGLKRHLGKAHLEIKRERILGLIRKITTHSFHHL